MSASRTAGIAALAASVLGVGVASTASAAATTALAGSAAPVATSGATGTPVKSGQKLSLQVWLAPDESGATAFDNAVSTPGSAEYGHYLSPAQYTSRFGPSAAEANAVESWLSSQGLSNVTVSPQRDYVSATGSVAKVDRAFSVQMKRYSVTDAAGKTTIVVTNDANLAIPSSLSTDVLSVTGLNSTQASTFHTATPATVKAAASPTKPQCSQYWAQYVKKITPSFDGITQSPISVCGYSADQLRDAYGMSTTNTGVGETIALIEVGVPKDMPQTLADYAATNNLPAPGASQFQEEIIGQGNKCGNAFDIEEQLDSEATYAMAPGADQLMVDGDSCNTQLEGVQPLFDAETAVLNGNGTSPSATIESNSWGITGGESYPSIYASTAHAIDLRAAGEGVSMLFSSGDNPGISVPASDPYSTAVGGTTIGLGQGDTRLFETGWSDDNVVKFRGQWVDEGIGRSAAGGGTSLLYAQPSYQEGVVPVSMSTTSAGAVDRAVPDISADADPNSGILQGIIETVNHKPVYVTFLDGGTSLASPLVAGIIADASQGQPSSFGFINPLLYSLSGSDAYNDALPVTSSTPVLDQTAFTPPSLAGLPLLNPLDAQGTAYEAYTDQVTATGYDTMTGLGTPDGSNFIYALRSGG
ncbi:MAG TPA: protease pro-enzyme activation domain-containing protein [Solirubrobacteraceae bacterium]